MILEFHHYHHFVDPSTSVKLDAILAQTKTIMKTADEILGAIGDEEVVIDKVLTLVGTLQQEVKDALSGTTLPPDVQAKLDAAFDKVTADKAKLEAALNPAT